MAAAVAVAARECFINLLITSVDCDPKAEIPFSGDHHRTPIRWNAIVDALNLANYSLATRRLAANHQRGGVAFLGLHASKKVAFLHSDDSERENREDRLYEISYDEELMNELPSFDCSLSELPRFHRFVELPDDLQASIIGRLDGVGFARMRCVSRHFSRLRWNRDFNICMYSNPDMVKAAPPTATRVENFLNILIHFAPGVCMAAAVAVSAILQFPGSRKRREYHNY